MTLKKSILYVDDEVHNLTTFKSVFKHHYNIMVAENAKKGLYMIKQAPVDVVITDYKMPEMNGFEFLSLVQKEFPTTEKIILTAFDDSELILRSVNEAHVFGYVTKPWKSEELKQLIDSALLTSSLRRENLDLIDSLKQTNQKLAIANLEITELKRNVELENSHLKKEIETESGGSNIVGSSKLLTIMHERIRQVAKMSTTVLIQGETGTGKELVARAIYKLSHLSNQSFLKLNCAALPSNLIESELFGYEKGSFTGSVGSKPGLFEIAHNGTIFLDEIGEIPIDMQPKLLRVLQEGEFYRIGASKLTKVNVRVLAASNRILQQEVSKGTFRPDLFFRLNIFPITVPPLRERIDDIPKLVEFFVEKYQRKLGIRISGIPKQTMEALIAYKWPGNIRELESTIERALIESQSHELRVANLDQGIGSITNVDTDVILTMEEMEKQHIIKVLTKTGRKISGPNGAAELLDLNHNTLRSRMIKLGISFRD